MFIEPMNGANSAKGISSVFDKNSFFKIPAVDKNSAFKDIFFSAINEVKTTEKEVAKNEYLFATGQLSDPHTLTIASTKAQASVELLINLRNKALDAYNTLMNMNV